MIRSLGVEVVPFDLPDVEIAAIDFIRYAETAAAFDDVTRSGTLREVEHGPEQSPGPPRSAPADSFPPSSTSRRTGIACASWNRWTPRWRGSICSSGRTAAHQPHRASRHQRAQRVLRTDHQRPSVDGQVVR